MKKSEFTPEFIKDLDALILNRRSVKPMDFSGEKIADSELSKMLELASWAPNHGSTEPWRFIIMKEKAIENYCLWQSDFYKKTKLGEEFSEAVYNRLLKAPKTCSHLIAIVLDRTLTRNIPLEEDLEALGGAMQNFHLSAVARGYAGFWSSGFPTYEKDTAKYFGLVEGQTLQGFFYLGVPKSDNPTAKRKALDEITLWLDE